jgi:hypothetical protein
MQRVTVLASGIIALVLAAAQGCGSDDDDTGTGGNAGSSASSGAGTGGGSSGTGGGSSGSGGGLSGSGGGSSGTGGGASGSGGAAGTGGGASGSGGAAGTGGGAAGTGGGGAIVCEGIRSNMPCPTAGVCENLACGLADTGTRTCTCATTWMCSSCMFPMGADAPGIILPPAEGETIEPCEASIMDETPCDAAAAMGNPVTRCRAANMEICACWMMEGMPMYDCDDAPWE